MTCPSGHKQYWHDTDSFTLHYLQIIDMAFFFFRKVTAWFPVAFSISLNSAESFWLPQTVGEPSFPCYLTYSWKEEERWIHDPPPPHVDICAKVNAICFSRFHRYLKSLKWISNNKNIYITRFRQSQWKYNYGYTCISTKNETLSWSQQHIQKLKWMQAHKNLSIKSRNC